MNFEYAIQYAQHRLEHELPSTLCYHSVGHTRDEVVPAVTRLARMEGVRGEPRKLLLTAAWFHDIGFIVQQPYHELISTRIIREVLPGFGYTPKQVEVVMWIILATILPQAPHTRLERIMVDADLDVLGSQDFVLRNQELRREMAQLGKEYSDESWYTSQIKFIQDHQYFTKSAHTLLGAQKLVNIAGLRRSLDSLSR